ncbi:MAG: argininosuccinate lyase [Verrucomicrobia bacterium]|nr:argininosuccinate lyase [Verrucomicrobiota bacterium]MBU4289614.1 argininosuccinate lyase [Verrucomicrobiota bacterium]MBU4428157.1 argininosuccinate lyase [Verrucomicrobiota bacterium]MCG2680208.1 argininosuccinate lyase [Kiritimatiellia bacterium]
MGQARKPCQTLVGTIAAEVLDYTAGKDIELDACLVDADCIGSAAHVVMLARMPGHPKLFRPSDRKTIVGELVRIMRGFHGGKLTIRVADQDVHMAVERILTANLGDLGRKIHTGRSRNDQVAVDLRLYGKEQLLKTMEEALALADVLLNLGRAHAMIPMVGRTHMQPAMPSSVGLWASAYAESLLEDMVLLRSAYALNDQCPLGSAAGYGVPLPIDRHYVSRLLGFSRPLHNVFHAGNTRGKMEAIILSALAQVMISLSRLAQDMMLFTMPEFHYMSLPPAMGTGSSIMPQKNNPDVLELVRARAVKEISLACEVMQLVRGLPGGYNRDLQEAKEPLLSGFHLARSSLRVMVPLIRGLKVNREALLAGFKPGVFAADAALELVGKGVSFRDAYRHVKEHLRELDCMDPHQAVARKRHFGATAGLDFQLLANRIGAERRFVRQETRRYYGAISRLLGVTYPL